MIEDFEVKNKNLNQNQIYNKQNDISIFFNGSVISRQNLNNVIGWLCTYTPEELIIASGFIPFRIMGLKNINKSEGFFPINFCPYLKASWESIYSNYERLSAIIFTSSCDGMRRLFDISKKYRPDLPSFILDIPRIINKYSLDYFTENLKDFVIFLEKLKSKKISKTKIEKAILLLNNKRKLLKELSDIVKKTGSTVDISTYYKIMALSVTSDPYLFIKDLEKYIDFNQKKIKNNKNILKKNSQNTPNIMIIGNFINEQRLWDIFSDIKLRLAAEDLCTSNRYFEKQVDINPNSNILKAIAYRYLYKPSCPRMADLGLKTDEVINLINRNNVNGVIFISLKFCDNLLYYFPLLKQKLNKLKIPALYLEIEYQSFSVGQIKTRIQAFLEML